ncbi:MAG: alpha/beta hydrolase [Candidatus Didemnitutus sp.]|nr:alpha/beta hydrolase [Candidatus Didemnitutus sp.]
MTALADSTVIPLWPEGVPDAQVGAPPEYIKDDRVFNVQVPTLTLLLPAPGTANGTAAIICPGGGYERLSVSNEGNGMARWLTAQGVTCFVLKYRLKEYGHPAPLRDVLRAVRLVRSRAAEFGLDPDRVGVFGSSAGGHLAATAATLYDHPLGKTGHELDAVSARPTFVVLQYPVILMEGPFIHSGSRKYLLGPNPDAALVALLSVDRQVTKDTPPAFLMHTAEDASVPLENSMAYYSALRRAGVDAELHLYEKGPHGFGLRTDLGQTSEWTKRCEEWMRSHGWLK